jgi:hypothetical protein
MKTILSKHKIGSAVALAFLICATAAAAYFLFLAQGTLTSDPVTLGTAGTQTVEVRIPQGPPAGMMPGQQTSVDAPIDAQAVNTSDNRVVVNTVKAEVLVDGQPAPAGYFTLGSNTQTLPKVIAAHSNDNVYTASLKFNDTGTDQSDVAGKALSIRITLNQ